MRVLFFHPNRLGDAVASLPTIQHLHRLRPEWEIAVIAGPSEAIFYQELPPDSPGVGHGMSQARLQVWAAERDHFNHSWRWPWRLFSYWKHVRNFRPGACVIGFDQGNVAHWLARGSGAAIRVGTPLPHVKIARSLTHFVPPPVDASAVRWSWEMGRLLWATLGGTPAEWAIEPPRPQLDHLFGAKTRNARGIVVHAGASSSFTQWPVARFAEVAAILSVHHPVTWIDRPETERVILPGTVVRRKSTSVSELMQTLAGSDFFFGNNSGPMHVANALNLAGLIVSGPTATGWDPFWAPEKWTVLRRPDLPCQPCQPTDVPLRVCANYLRPHACLLDWSAASVATQISQRIQDLDTTRSEL